jgi:hypothetical protein
VTIQTKDTARFKGALVSNVCEHGYTLVQGNPFSLSFTKSMDGQAGTLYQATLGNALSSTPQMNFPASLVFPPICLERTLYNA